MKWECSVTIDYSSEINSNKKDWINSNIRWVTIKYTIDKVDYELSTYLTYPQIETIISVIQDNHSNCKETINKLIQQYQNKNFNKRK